MNPHLPTSSGMTLAARACMLALPLLVAGCGAMRTAYVAPQVEIPGQWQATQGAQADQAAENAAAASSPWWKAFGDPQLDRVIEEALARNADLASVALTVRKEQLQAQLTARDELPALSGSISGQAQRALESPRTITRSSGTSLSASYDLDLWGRLASATDAAAWEAQATAQDRQSTALALTATAANLYWQIGYLNQRITSGEDGVAYARRTRELVRVQYQAGAMSAPEMEEADQSVASQEAALSALRQQRVEARNALAILFDAPPGTAVLARILPAEPERLPAQALPTVAPGLPAHLLGQRPDVQAAESRLRATLSDRDTARANFYPAVTLTGALGTTSASLRDVLRNPYALLGAGVTLPFLQLRELQLRNEISRASHEAAVIAFRSALYAAFSDVENALSASTALAEQEALLARSLAATQRVEALYEVRYRNGAVALKLWLDAQETRRNAETALAENRLSRLANLSGLYKALGGPMAVALPIRGVP